MSNPHDDNDASEDAAAEQVVAVQRRLLQSMPEFAELQRQTNINARILVELVRAFASAPSGPYIHVLGLYARWRSDAAYASGTYYTFTQWIAHHAPPPQAPIINGDDHG